MEPKSVITNQKGIILMIVLSVVLVVTVLANIATMIVSSQSRLTEHQVGRLQAYYAAQAGIQYTIEMLRLGPASGGWSVPLAGSLTRTICPQAAGCDVVNSGLPYRVTITVLSNGTDPDGAGLPQQPIPDTAPIRAFVNYTYIE